MKLTVSRGELLNGLDRVAGAVDKRPLYPLLGHILFEVFLRGVVLSATDTMVYAVTELPAVSVDLGGKVAVPADRFRAAVDRSGAEISMHLGEGMVLSLNSEGRHFEMPCLDATDYPEPFNLAYTSPFTLDHGVLPDIVKGLKHAISSDANKPHLGGIHITCRDGAITSCATDGHRLSLSSREYTSPWAPSFSFTLPSRACNMLSDIGSAIDVSYPEAGSMVQFQSGKNDIGARLLEGDYPNFRAVICQDLDKGITVNSAALVEALESCGVMGDDAKHKSVQLTTVEGVLTLTTLGVTGTAMVMVPYLGDEMPVLRMNSRYLIQAVKAMASEEVFIKFKDALKPVIVIPVDHGQWSERLEVIMPLRG